MLLSLIGLYATEDQMILLLLNFLPGIWKKYHNYFFPFGFHAVDVKLVCANRLSYNGASLSLFVHLPVEFDSVYSCCVGRMLVISEC